MSVYIILPTKIVPQLASLFEFDRAASYIWGLTGTPKTADVQGIEFQAALFNIDLLGVSDAEHKCVERFHKYLRETKDPAQFRQELAGGGASWSAASRNKFWTHATFRDRKQKPESDLEKYNFRMVEFPSLGSQRYYGGSSDQEPPKEHEDGFFAVKNLYPQKQVRVGSSDYTNGNVSGILHW